MNKSFKALTIGAALTISGSQAALADASDPIRIAINEWTGQNISAHILGETLKNNGFTVEYITAGAVPQFAAIAEGNLHVQPETWDNNVGEIYPKAIESGKIISVGPLGLEPREGWMYPPYMEETCPGLPAASALAECAMAFGNAETFPNGRLITYPADWGTRSKELVENAGLPYAAIPGGSEGAMVAELKSAYASEQPMLMMFWAPHWIHAELEMNWVDMPPADENCGTDATLGFSPAAVDDCGFAQANIGKIVWGGFAENWPKAYTIVENMALDNTTQNNLMLEIDNGGRKLEEAVADWMTSNEATWQAWAN